jgi:hypothetical protein
LLVNFSTTASSRNLFTQLKKSPRKKMRMKKRMRSLVKSARDLPRDHHRELTVWLPAIRELRMSTFLPLLTRSSPQSRKSSILHQLRNQL